MTEPEEQPSREEAFYSIVLAFLKRHGFEVAFFAPLAVLLVVPQETGGNLVVLVIWLVEAIAYVGIRRRRRIASGGARSGPGCLRALWGVLASVLIVIGSIGLAAAGESPPIVPVVVLALGIAMFAWGWHRVSRASGEDTSASRPVSPERWAVPASRGPGRSSCG